VVRVLRLAVDVAALALDLQRRRACPDALQVRRGDVDAHAAVVDVRAVDLEFERAALAGRGAIRRRGHVDRVVRPRARRRGRAAARGAPEPLVRDVALATRRVEPSGSRVQDLGDVRVDQRLVAVDVQLLGVRVEDDVAVEMRERHLVVDAVGVQSRLGIEPVA
jgi:hypothetical protein